MASTLRSYIHAVNPGRTRPALYIPHIPASSHLVDAGHRLPQQPLHHFALGAPGGTHQRRVAVGIGKPARQAISIRPLSVSAEQALPKLRTPVTAPSSFQPPAHDVAADLPRICALF